MAEIITHINKARLEERSLLAVLIDPDEYSESSRLMRILQNSNECGVDLIFIGGSLLKMDRFDDFVKEVKSLTDLPVVLFPGGPAQISGHADAILFLSLISGRNPELLIGSQVMAAPRLAKMNIEIIPTGYMLIDCGRRTTAHYVSQTDPIPHDKSEIASATALAGEMLGMSCIYMDGGSGAPKTISAEMISAVRAAVDLPVIIGGGIRTIEDVHRVCMAGADVVVIGNVLEENPSLVQDLSIEVHRQRIRTS